ncbi:serine hydrolase [Tessaracoccus antarcticus]|nr:serine hydrolase [Tessaracoccus antarcticus]
MLATPSLSAADPTDGRHPVTGRFDVVFTGFAPADTVLQEERPARLRLDPAPIQDAWDRVDAFAYPEDPAALPMYASAAAVIGHQGRIVGQHVVGDSLKYADGQGTLLPESERIEARHDTIYDMASVTKLFTSILVMQLVEQGEVDLDAAYAQYVPEFATHGKEAITVRQMLTHTSGLVAWLPLWSQYPDKDSRIEAVMDTTPISAPGTSYTYSDLNLISLGVLAEQMTGTPLDVLLQERITEPLGMVDTSYTPDPSLRQRIAATEFQTSPARGMVWGEVHDENAWSLGGVAGHAGVFSTTADMAVLAQTMLNGGTYDGARILEPESVQAMVTDENAAFPGDAHGLGFELNQLWYMSGVSGPRTAGHTGYTGTSLVIDFQSRSFVVLLTNRVHPSRAWGSNNPARRAVTDGLAAALAVQPRKGSTAWFGGASDAAEHTLQLALPDRSSNAVLHFDAFADNEATDIFAVETSDDAGATWTLLPTTITTESADGPRSVPTDGTWNNQGLRTWGSAVATLPAAAQLVRWRYTTDTNTRGRGVLVDDVRVTVGDTVLFNGEKRTKAFTASGFVETRR